MRKWTNPDDKKAACIAVLNKIAEDKIFGEKCLKSDAFAREAFRTIGKIDVPKDAKVVFLPEGDVDNSKRDGSGSLVIELPPSRNGKKRNGHTMEYVRCSYTLW
jgi:hypothetical protein